MKSKHQVRQEGVHPQKITSYEILKQKIEYIHNNPVKRELVASRSIGATVQHEIIF